MAKARTVRVSRDGWGVWTRRPRGKAWDGKPFTLGEHYFRRGDRIFGVVEFHNLDIVNLRISEPRYWIEERAVEYGRRARGQKERPVVAVSTRRWSEVFRTREAARARAEQLAALPVEAQ